MTRGILLQISFLLVCALLPASAGSPKVPITISYSRSILVPATVNGQKVVLILDTGAGDTYLDSGKLTVPLPKSGEREVLTPTGKIVRPSYSAHIIVGAYDLTGDVTDLDLSPLRKSCRCEAAGILGMNALHRFSQVKINFRESTLELDE